MRKILGLPLAWVLLLLAATWGYMIHVLQFRFGGYDLSPLIDAGWRVLSGQIPNRDFVCTFPPLLYLGAALAFRLFGVHWIALSWISALFSISISLLGFRLLLCLRDRLPHAAVHGLGYTFATLQLLPALLVGHPWHSSWTGAVAMYALLATFALALSADQRSSFHRELIIHLAFADALLLLAKPNTAIPTLLVSTLVVLLRPHRWRNATLPLCGGITLASLALLFVHTSLLTTYRVYFQLSSRLGSDSGFGDLFSNPFVPGGLPDLAVYLSIFPTFLWVLFVAGRALRNPSQRWISALALGAVTISILGLGTNVEFRLVDVSCLLLGASLFATAVPGSSTRLLQGMFAQALFSLLVIGFFYAETRARMQAVGEWAEAGCGPLLQQKDSFFGTFHGCSAFFSVLAEVDAAHSQYPSQHVFFGPRMEFLYAREHVPSPPGLPLWWHPGSSFPEPALPRVIQAWNTDRFDVLVFLHDDRTRLPRAILESIDQNYRPVALLHIAPEKLPAEAHIDVYLHR